jgi:hypothetical protein
VTGSAGLDEAVSRIVREVSAAVIEPRFRALADGEARLKEPGEPVTGLLVATDRATWERARTLLD